MLQSRLVIFAVFAVTLAALTTFDGKQKVYTKATRCNASEKFFFSNFSCYAKSYSRNSSVSFMYMVAKAPINNLTMTGTLYYKYGMIFRDVIRSPHIDICTLEQDLQENRLLVHQWGRTVADIIVKSAPGLLHKCPYYGMNAKNVTWALDCIPSILPSGEYRLIFSAFIGGEFAGTVNVMFTVDSPIKENFGK